MPTKTVTRKQLETLLKKADKTVQVWTTYKQAIETALSSNPPGPAPRPPKG